MTVMAAELIGMGIRREQERDFNLSWHLSLDDAMISYLHGKQ
jgi:hypothetical protein